jgi:hypothetical protein
MVTSREIGQLSLNGEKIMDASGAPHSNLFPSFGPNEFLFFAVITVLLGII